jgi:hypothetical protein
MFTALTSMLSDTERILSEGMTVSLAIVMSLGVLSIFFTVQGANLMGNLIHRAVPGQPVRVGRALLLFALSALCSIVSVMVVVFSSLLS